MRSILAVICALLLLSGCVDGDGKAVQMIYDPEPEPTQCPKLEALEVEQNESVDRVQKSLDIMLEKLEVSNQK